MYRNIHKAHEDVKRVLRDGEKILSSCTSKQVGSSTYRRPRAPGEVDTTYIYTTNARLIWMSANNDGMISVPWSYLKTARVARRKMKHTLAFSFQNPSSSQPTDMGEELISKETAQVIKGIQDGIQKIYKIPDEFTTAKRKPRPRSSGLLGELEKAMNVPDSTLVCSACGVSAGMGDELWWEECNGCLRRFSGIE